VAGSSQDLPTTHPSSSLPIRWHGYCCVAPIASPANTSRGVSFAGKIRGYDHPLALDSPSGATLSQRFHDHIPQLIPAGFFISRLPSEISSIVIQGLQMTESSLSQSRKNPTKNVTEPGVDTPPSAPSQGFTMTPSSLNYPNPKENSSSEPFSPSTGLLAGTSQAAFLASVRAPWFL
jgi:hypothetical protein